MSSEFFRLHQIFINTVGEIPTLATIKSLSDDFHTLGSLLPWPLL